MFVELFFFFPTEVTMAVSCTGFLMVMMAAEWPTLLPSV